jgi:hypothetical protein
MARAIPAARLRELPARLDGLTADEVRDRRRYGSNDIVERRRRGWRDVVRDTAGDPCCGSSRPQACSTPPWSSTWRRCSDRSAWLGC